MSKVVAILSLFVSLTRIIEGGDPCFRVDNATEDVTGRPYGIETNCTSSCDINVWIIHSKTRKWFVSTRLDNLQEYRNEYQKCHRLELNTSTVSSDVANEHNISCQTKGNVTTLAVQILPCLNLEIKQFRYQMELQRNGEKTVSQLLFLLKVFHKLDHFKGGAYRRIPTTDKKIHSSSLSIDVIHMPGRQCGTHREDTNILNNGLR